MRAHGELPDTTLVWRAGLAGWQPLSEMQELMAAVLLQEERVLEAEIEAEEAELMHQGEHAFGGAPGLSEQVSASQLKLPPRGGASPIETGARSHSGEWAAEPATSLKDTPGRQVSGRRGSGMPDAAASGFF